MGFFKKLFKKNSEEQLQEEKFAEEKVQEELDPVLGEDNSEIDQDKPDSHSREEGESLVSCHSHEGGNSDEVVAEAVVTKEPIDCHSRAGGNPEKASKPEVQEKPVPRHSRLAKNPEKAAPAKTSKKSFFQRLKSGLQKTRKAFGGGLSRVILGKKVIDQDLLDEIEMILLTADVGVDVTTQIIDALTDQHDRKTLKDPQALMEALKNQLVSIVKPVEQPLDIPARKEPYIILMVGVNGAGKTTTIGKLAKQFQAEGKSVMLAAGDTFRAAAVEQLQVWGERNDIPVVAQATGADSASVIFDAVNSARAKGVDVLIADTAGRLHNKSNLMEELAKVKRVMKKLDDTAPHEVMLVLDANNGQNALIQAVQFHESVDVTGITVTKLDGTAKGGILFAIADKMNLPIRYIGVGEQIDDLRTFNAEDFVKVLFD